MANLATPKIGIPLIIIGFLFLAAGIIIGIIIQVKLVPDGFNNFLVYKKDSKWDDPSYEDCTNETFNAFFFNMTNSDAVKSSGAKPNYAQVGPYNFTREVCTFGLTAGDGVKTYHKYWKPYYLKPSGTVSDNDTIVNFNAGYLGIIKSVETSISPVNPETSLAATIVGGVLLQVFQNFQSDSFLQQAKVLGIPLILSGLRSTVVPQVEITIKATAGVGVILQTLSLGVPVTDFFNTVGAANGIATFLGASLSIQPNSQNLVLFGNTSAGEPKGWLTDRSAGSGVTTFLSVVGGAVTRNDSATLANMTAAYQLQSVNQLLGLLQYANGRIIGSLWQAVYNATTVTQLATNLFYSQWANNSGIDPRGLDITQDGRNNDGFEVNGLAPSNISLASATALWNANNTDSILSLTGITKWFGAMSAFNSTGNFSAFGTLPIAFGITPSQLIILITWLGRWQSTIVEPFLLQQLRLTSLRDDLGYLQWGTGVLEGASVADFDVTVPAPPEFSVFASKRGLPLRLSVARSRALLNGTFLGSTSATLTFLGLVSAQQWTTIQTVYGLNATEAPQFAAYLQYVMSSFVDPTIRSYFPKQGGPIASKRPRDILFEGVDPLASFLQNRRVQVGAFYDTEENYTTRADAEARQPLLSDRIYNGGSKDDLNDFLQKKDYKGNTTIWQYNNIPVEGNKDGKNFVPGWLKKDKDELVWYDVVRRPTIWAFKEEFEIKGIPLWKFVLTQENWGSQTQTPSRMNYFQVYEGLLNVTPIKGVRSYLSRPHYLKTDPEVSSTVDGLNPNNPYYDETYFGVHQESGISMVQSLKAQLTYEYPALTRYYNITYGGFAPVMWRDDYLEISDDDADKFKNTLKGAQDGAIIAYVVGGGLGLILMGLGIAALVIWKQKSSAARDEDEGGTDLKTIEKNDEGQDSKSSDDDDDDDDTSESESESKSNTESKTSSD